MSTRTMELLRTWGLEQAVRAGAMRVRPGLAVSDTLTGAQREGMEFGYPTDAQALAVSPTTPCYCPQDHLEPALLAHLRARGGRVRFSTEVTCCSTDATGVRAELRDRCSGQVERVRARYLIGADGPRSSARAGSASRSTIWARSASSWRVHADLTHRLRLATYLNVTVREVWGRTVAARGGATGGNFGRSCCRPCMIPRSRSRRRSA